MSSNAASADADADALARIGEQLRAYRKALRITATAAAEAAGISRVTLHRIEKGETSVAMGAYMACANALGLTLQLAGGTVDQQEAGPGWIPSRVAVSDYPQLAMLAWQVGPQTLLTPREAFDIYERNSKHLDVGKLSPAERELIAALRTAFGTRSSGHV